MRARTLAPLAPAAALLLLPGCAGSPGSAPPEAPPMRLVAYDGCGSLLADLRRATAARVGPYGLSGPTPYTTEGDTALPRGAVPKAAQPAPADGRSAAAAPEHTGTNVHEPGADEPDIVKTDGRRIVALADGRLQVIDPATRKVAHTLSLPGRRGTPPGGESQMLLAGDRVLVLTPRSPYLIYDGPGGRTGDVGPPGRPGGVPQTELTLIDVSGAPKVLGTMTSDSTYLDARLSGSVARVVVRSTPRIAFPPHGPQASRPNAGSSTGLTAEPDTERNRKAVREAPLDAWLPAFSVTAGGAAKTYRTPCDQVSHPASFTGTSLLTVLTLDLARGLGDPSPVGIAADADTVYGNGKSLYVTGAAPRPVDDGVPGRRTAPGQQRTDVHAFDTTGSGRPKYMASGSVAGTLLNQYSMSELNGDLRIATTTEPTFAPATGPAPAATTRPSVSTLYVLARRGARLQEVGRAGGLGRGERIYSVRFLGPLAYVVTFRQVDPLYVVDLHDPARPRVTGELKISGYSAYLHPMADGKLLGIGQDADAAGRTTGLQASLFDVTGTPRRLAVHRLPGASSQAEFEPHAFTYLPSTGLVVVPVSRPPRGGGEALALRVTGTGIGELGRIGDLGEGPRGIVRRSLVVGGTLWTFSDGGARATDTRTLADRGRIRYPTG